MTKAGRGTAAIALATVVAFATAGPVEAARFPRDIYFDTGQLAVERVRAIFVNRDVPIASNLETETARLDRIAHEVLALERGATLPAGYDSVRRSVERIAANLEPADLNYTPSVTPGNATTTRAALVDYVWKGAGYPYGLTATTSEYDIAAPVFFADVDGIDRIDRHTLEMSHGVNSTWYLLASPAPDGCLLVHHIGHSGDVATARPVITPALGAGCDVALMQMPLIGPDNSRPFASHDELGTLDGDVFSPLTFFLDPVAAVLNDHADSYDRVVMAGLSGGGWTTTLAAALDERIERSYPVAGSLPLRLRPFVPGSAGDWEQETSGFYGIAGYLDLHVLATTGGRSQVQILNEYDGCCFAGTEALLYEPAVRDAARLVGGTYDLVILPVAGHAITDEAVRIIMGGLA